MKHTMELIKAVRVVVRELGTAPGAVVQIPADLVAAALEEKRGPGPEDLMQLWNELRDKRLPECLKLNTKRRRACTARLREFPEQKDWVAFMGCINKNNWMLGVTPSPGFPYWKADFDWFIRPGNILKFMEGRFRQNFQYKTARDTYGDDLDERNRAHAPGGG